MKYIILINGLLQDKHFENIKDAKEYVKSKKKKSLKYDIYELLDDGKTKHISGNY